VREDKPAAPIDPATKLIPKTAWQLPDCGCDQYNRGVTAVSKFKASYFKLREKIRRSPFVGRVVYFGQSFLYSNFGAFRSKVLRATKKHPGKPRGVALCCRIRDESRYLEEFIEYYRVAGIEHFFFYEKLSKDNYRAVLEPYVDRGIVTLLEGWPHVPVSPAAEHDCILRAVGRFEWVGFIDADEFVVFRDSSSIGEFLSKYRTQVGVALHWYMFGSNGHTNRPGGPVIAEYTRRASDPNRHVKCFVRPEELRDAETPIPGITDGCGMPSRKTAARLVAAPMFRLQLSGHGSITTITKATKTILKKPLVSPFSIPLESVLKHVQQSAT
jgi:Glycosyltransferase family 92